MSMAISTSNSASAEQNINTLVIGAGDRIKETILPSLSCLTSQFNLVGIYSRTLFSAKHCTDIWGGLPSDELAIFSDKKIDLIIVAVTTKNLVSVIDSINFDYLSKVTLLIDTPVVGNISDFKTLNSFKKFKDVLVTEDCIALPIVELAKQLIKEGKIGRVRKIQFHHSGFKYHAIATSRALAEQSYILSSKLQKMPNNMNVLTMRMGNGVNIVVQEPRDYSVGRTLIIGDKGYISDYPLDANNGYHISYLLDKQKLVGIALNGQEIEYNQLDKLYFSELDYSKFENVSLINLLKIRAVMTLLNSIKENDRHYCYSLRDGLYDAVSSKLVFGLKFFWDPLCLLKGNIVSLLLFPFVRKVK